MPKSEAVHNALTERWGNLFQFLPRQEKLAVNVVIAYGCLLADRNLRKVDLLAVQRQILPTAGEVAREFLGIAKDLPASEWIALSECLVAQLRWP